MSVIALLQWYSIELTRSRPCVKAAIRGLPDSHAVELPSREAALIYFIRAQARGDVHVLGEVPRH